MSHTYSRSISLYCLKLCCRLWRRREDAWLEAGADVTEKQQTQEQRGRRKNEDIRNRDISCISGRQDAGFQWQPKQQYGELVQGRANQTWIKHTRLLNRLHSRRHSLKISSSCIDFVSHIAYRTSYSSRIAKVFNKFNKQAEHLIFKSACRTRHSTVIYVNIGFSVFSRVYLVGFETPAMLTELLVSIHPTGSQQRNAPLFCVCKHLMRLVKLSDSRDSDVIQSITGKCPLSLTIFRSAVKTLHCK